MENKEHPLMYKGYIIRRHVHNSKLCAKSWATGYFINPLYETWEQLKLIIDGLEDSRYQAPVMGDFDENGDTI